MSTWSDLEQQFRKLAAVMPDARLERQWNDSMDDWTLTGSAPIATTGQFRMLSDEAGRLLKEAGELPADVAEETDTVDRWYRALWSMGGPHEPPIMGMMSSYGRAGGAVHIARIKKPAHVAADLAQRLAARSA